ncbi:MAG: AAA family ATPase [Deltaproteobacteria bacterium]|nr:AAA family ATPase [Deltaproteobacteria bacterium]
MRCSKCGSDNREGANFCNACGTRLGNKCAACGALNQPGAKFCDECGATLTDDATLKVEAIAPVMVPSTAERRHLTVLFCDLVGSTEIAAQLDPEEWREVVAGYHRAAAEAITRFGGHVAQYLGDGVMAYFGWPEAHDNDGERAARAALALLDVVLKLNHESSPKLAARVGIDSGAVVVGAGVDKDAEVFGETPNIAARLQATAAPGTVLITAATHRLISGLFIVEAMGPRALKGVATRLDVFQVVRPTGVRGRLAAARSLTPFVGREEELRLLLSRWQRACEGEGQLGLVVGEAGIGKSRLVAEFHDRIRDTPHIWLESAGEQFFQNSPFHALIEMLSQWLQMQGGDANAGAMLERLERVLAWAGLKLDEAVPLVAELLQLPVGDRYRALALVPEQKRRRLFAVLMGWVFAAARLQALVMVVEDLHWLDPSTLELQQLLAEQGVTVPLMLLYTARPEFRAPWPMRAHHAQITLNRLSARDVREMVALVAARNALASESVEAVVERTGGVPLFVEELTRAVLESGSAKLAGREIPVTLHDSLMARLDRLGPAKEVLQIGAVIGSEFSYELLEAVHPIGEKDLQHSLDSAADAQLVYVRGIAPQATYQFKHALIRDAAYEALLKSRRKDLHRWVAQAIDEKFPALKTAHPEAVARHWTEAGEAERAIAEWSKAAKAAESRNAFIEAQESLQQAVVLLNQRPESRERDVSELELREELVFMLLMTRGWVSPEAVEAAARVRVLAERSGNLQQLVLSMGMRCFHAFLAGHLTAATALADEALELAQGDVDSFMVAHLHLIEVLVRFYRGDLGGAEKHFAAGLRFFGDADFGQSHLGGRIAIYGWASFNAWMLGRAHVARERLVKMKAAVNLTNPHDPALSDSIAGRLHFYMRENESAEAFAARALEQSEKHRFPAEAVLSRCLLGEARAQLGRTAEGITLISQGIDALVQVGSCVGAPLSITSLAAAQLRAGAIGDALETVENALNFNPQESVHVPETLRIRGEIRVKQGELKLAEEDFRNSIALARGMGAKAWELRTTTSLARLLSDIGRSEEARAMLAAIYDWFTEGLDTADLKEAKALLNELSLSAVSRDRN